MYDLVVVGGGPGGYSAALRAAQLGGRVVLVERAELGGVCTNRGCIPTKALISSAEAFDRVKNAVKYGVKSGTPEVDFNAMIARRDMIVSLSRKGVDMLLKKANVNVVKGTARIVGKDSVEVEGRIIDSNNIIIATGSEPKGLPGLEFDGELILSSDDIMKLNRLPESVLIVGGGIIGVEYASLFSKLGCKVSMVELMDRLIPNEDEEISEELKKILSRGVSVHTKSKVAGVDKKARKANISTPEGVKQISFDMILVSVGRKPVFPEGLDKVGVKYDKTGIKVNEQMQTSVRSIYAVGDVASKHQLAHVASAEGVVAAENCMDIAALMYYDSVPWGIFNIPEIGRVGLTEREATEKHGEIKVGRALYAANGKANCIGEREGFCKVVCSKDGVILGVHIIGAHASDLIAEAALAVKNKLTVRDIAATIHSHPTLPEVFKEACENAI